MSEEQIQQPLVEQRERPGVIKELKHINFWLKSIVVLNFFSMLFILGIWVQLIIQNNIATSIFEKILVIQNSIASSIFESMFNKIFK